MWARTVLSHALLVCISDGSSTSPDAPDHQESVRGASLPRGNTMTRLPAIPQAEAQLCARLDRITTAHIAALPGSTAREDQYLDFKAATPDGRPPIDKVIKAIAAFANADGGVVVVGVAENAGCPVELRPLADLDVAEASLRNACDRQLSPIPEWRVVPLAEPGGGGYLLIVVPRSPSRPHAQALPGQDQIFYRMRSGQTTRSLKPFEVAREYRSYFERLSSRDRRLGEVMASTWQSLYAPDRETGDRGIWVNAVLVPLEAVRHRTDEGWRRRFEEQLATSPVSSAVEHFTRPITMLVAPDRAGAVVGTKPRNPMPREAAAEVLATDSAIRVAFRIVRVEQHPVQFRDGTHTVPTPFVDEIEYGRRVFDAMALAIDLAAAEGLEGVASLAVRVGDRGSPTEAYSTNFVLARLPLDRAFQYDEDGYHIGHWTVEPVIDVDVSELWRDRGALVAAWWEILVAAARHFGATRPAHLFLRDGEPWWADAPASPLPTWHSRPSPKS